MYLQTTKHGCGLYALANALQLKEDFIKKYLSASVSGLTIGQLNIYLFNEGLDIFMQPLYYDSSGFMLPKNQNYDSEVTMPLIICVTRKESQIGHFIGAHLKKGVLTVFDSLEHCETYTTLSDLNIEYGSVYGVFALCGLIGGEYCTFE